MSIKRHRFTKPVSNQLANARQQENAYFFGIPMPTQISWFLFEGLLPLIGAGLIYLLWGVFRYLASTNRAEFTYHWREADDPLGWLYGSVILAAQSALQSFSSHGNQALAWKCLCIGLLSLLLLVSAMTDRGATSTWKPPLAWQLLAIVFVGATLYFGLTVHTPIPGALP
jgi:hypothetical protein